ncbi:hypothetical protein A9G25_04600 [Gilliamella sp. Bif1-4]|nr:hypothetical protein A9G25_04600 [Gilliamella apicola]
MLHSLNLQALTSKTSRIHNNRSDAIILPSSMFVNYVRPNLSEAYDGDKYAGPADIWNLKKGFLVQSINPELYDLNFPTTGADNLYFDLLISGVDINELKWEPVTHEGITATVTNVDAHEWLIPYEDRGVVARVTLTGPEASNQRDNPHPNPIAKPQLPQTFELVGRDINTGDEVVKYGFVLKQWFVNREMHAGFYSEQLAWCNSLGYRLSRVRDLTNAVRKANPSISGAAPSSSGNFYMRHIGAGFFTEWGGMYYPGSGLVGHYYWASDATGSTQFVVYPVGGYVGVRSDSAGDTRFGLCTAP